MIDSHCHLADEDFVEDLDAVVARAGAAGVTSALCILAAQDRPELARAVEVRRLWPAVRFAVGVHPHAAGEFADRMADVASDLLTAIDRTPGVAAVGEIGLDYHYTLAPRDVQKRVFSAQIDFACERGLPIVVHTREAMADTVEIIAGAGDARTRGVIHCFTGTAEEAEAALALGFYVSFSGILTFPKSGAVREAAAVVPIDRLLVETDAPYLAPTPHRGTRNEPAFVGLTAARLAEIKGVTLGDLEQAVAANFARLFAHDQRPDAATPRAIR